MISKEYIFGRVTSNNLRTTSRLVVFAATFIVNIPATSGAPTGAKLHAFLYESIHMSPSLSKCLKTTSSDQRPLFATHFSNHKEGNMSEALLSNYVK